MASFNPPSIHFDNINFNESHFTDNQNRDLTLQRVMSVFQNLNQMGLTTDSNTKVVLNEQPIQQEEGTTTE